jgi:Zn ribbon nucleic-acid-binding protein
LGIEFDSPICEYPCGHPKEFHKGDPEIPCLLCYALQAQHTSDDTCGPCLIYPNSHFNRCEGFKPDKCAQCGHEDVRSRDERRELKYGVDGPDQVTLNTIDAIRRCVKCGFEFLDWETEHSHDRTVKFYLFMKEYRRLKSEGKV